MATRIRSVCLGPVPLQNQNLYDEIEAIKNRAVAIIIEIRVVDYFQTLENLRIESLQDRCEHIIIPFGKTSLASPQNCHILPQHAAVNVMNQVKAKIRSHDIKNKSVSKLVRSLFS